MIGDSTLSVVDTSDISKMGETFSLYPGLWDLLTCKNVNTAVITTDDLKSYKNILQLTNAHLQGYELKGNVQASR
jgi:hypothetical protein